jgi:tripartite-type tricarboxylate transporter receptor subunit TctC
MKKLFVLAALLCIASIAVAQTYPSRVVRIIVPYPAGSGPDNIGRLVALKLQETFGQPFIVENRPGALANVGTAEVARAAPDGYTFLLTTNTPHGANPALFKKLPYDPVKDFAPVGRIISTSMILLVKSDFPASNLKEFAAYARSRPEGLTAGYGSAGSQVSIAKVRAYGKFKTVDVPYKGVTPAVADVVGGQVDFSFADYAVALAQIHGGRLKGLGVTALSRTPLAPSLPAFAEDVPGFDVSLWYGLVAPAGTPREIINRIYDAMAAAMNTAEIKARLGATGLEVSTIGPDAFGEFIKAEIAKWARDAKEAGIEPE